ncbi:MAG: hypothetical protein CME70_14095 [Halobacteriovorax sp.]|nr:hypothetical protein [Halobacteriovorax sp.]|tara:strand:+ start:821 stop:1180 length:360 start_codon:yes stop_codon:yes gene_type:complete
MKVQDLRRGMLLRPKKGSCLVICTSGKFPDRHVKIVPDIIGPGFPSWTSLAGGTWIYLGTKRVLKFPNSASTQIVHTEKLQVLTRKVHEIFHSVGGVFTIEGMMFKDISPMEEILNEAQ